MRQTGFGWIASALILAIAHGVCGQTGQSGSDIQQTLRNFAADKERLQKKNDELGREIEALEQRVATLRRALLEAVDGDEVRAEALIDKHSGAESDRRDAGSGKGIEVIVDGFRELAMRPEDQRELDSLEAEVQDLEDSIADRQDKLEEMDRENAQSKNAWENDWEARHRDPKARWRAPYPKDQIAAVRFEKSKLETQLRRATARMKKLERVRQDPGVLLIGVGQVTELDPQSGREVNRPRRFEVEFRGAAAKRARRFHPGTRVIFDGTVIGSDGTVTRVEGRWIKEAG